MLRALARVNVAAIERNVQGLRSRLAPGAGLCAVVKANASGHGALVVSRAALRAGAIMLAVATADEAAEIRAGGIVAPLLVLGALSAEELPTALAAGAEVTAWSESFVAALEREAAGRDRPIRVHVKLDTGLGRLGTRALAEAVTVSERVEAAPGLELAGAMTHFATADDDPDFMREQLGRFVPFATLLRSRAPGIVVHTANSAATVAEPDSHFDMVRCGIALHGCDPMNQAPDRAGLEPQLEPAMELSSYVAAVKLAEAGDSAGYGRRFIASRETWIATLPIGYADGVRRALSNNCDVLIGGRRYPLVGIVSMDNITVDLGPEPEVPVGTQAILIGRSGDQRQTVEDISNRLGTVAHEVLCGISARVPRSYHRDGEPEP